MIKKLKTYLLEGAIYTGLELHDSDQGEVYHLLEIKRTQGELLINRKGKASCMEELVLTINKQYPIFLCINTPNILLKSVENIGSEDREEALVNLAFPNLDLENFYYEIVKKTDTALVSIARKGSIDTQLAKLADSKIKISNFSLGLSAFDTIVPYLDEETIQVSNHQITILDNSMIEILPSTSAIKQKYTINGLKMDSSLLLSFSAVLKHLNSAQNGTNFGDLSKKLEWNFKNDRIFDKVLKLSLAFFVVLLLGNFMVYNIYHEKVGELNTSVSATGAQKEELTLLDASVKRKEERVETLSASSNSMATFYLDLFAQGVPNSILLSEIKYQPLAKPVREKKPVILEEKTLLIAGISKDVNEFSHWIERLEKYVWVQSVETLDYDYISKETSNFLIQLEFQEKNP